MLTSYTKNNGILTSIILFFFFFLITIYSKPGFIFNRDGTLKNFGLGLNTNSVISIEIIVIVLAILSYFVINCLVVTSSFNK